MCLLSVDEPWGLVVNEALVHGCGLILSPHVGSCDLLEDGRNGILVDTSKPDWIAESILKLRSLERSTILNVSRQKAIESSIDRLFDKLSLQIDSFCGD